ncbi:Gfo/Idh/MocA family protein [Truepera radiovictrix]|uniref:Oxidoreductase domain protein n=1 Tax=Truepera radiovictrix (strain DSM 17093 / CIP 108686 / LMG 22925 / RQ-24) TaxID=649638 RepID=D7CQS5_TRURR|nr:Gfo/Idh/MocA family oxidoreductase [Truepera radiovictrix]ADI15059.1 oxidoreductase domain protein [Truepera radiovictrix DSM 17093]WMT56388.1 Gfo/Idh/MocA family oxidoreductase [Truepera radiovictrix]
MALRLIHAGFGGWGLDWVRHTTSVPEVRVVGVVDPRPAALEAARARYALPVAAAFASLGDALAATDAEAVLVTAPAAAHAPLALEALAAGKHVLVEKPLAETLEAARAVVAAAEAQGRVLMVSQNYRFFPAPLAVRALLAEGALGALGSVYVDFRFPMPRLLPAGHPYFALRDPLLLDMAIHHFDLLRFTLRQEAGAVSCTAWNPPGSPFAHPAVAAVTVQLRGGAVMSYRGSWLSNPRTNWAGVWRLEGSRGRLTWTSRNGRDLGGEAVTLRGRRVTLPEVAHPGRRGVLVAFAEAVATEQEPPSSGRENLGSLALTLGAVAAAAAGRAVRF